MTSAKEIALGDLERELKIARTIHAGLNNKQEVFYRALVDPFFDFLTPF
jgi:hypothetical protein